MKRAEGNNPALWPVFILALITASFLVYYNTLANGFVYDDKFQIAGNPAIRDFRNLPRLFISPFTGFMAEQSPIRSYRPMVFAVFIAEYAAFGLKPWGWHLTNIIFHTANTILVFITVSLLLERQGKDGLAHKALSPYLPFGAALLFLTHPVNSETVAWASCIPELVYTFFTILSFYMYLKSSGSCEGKDEKCRAILRSFSVLSFFAALFAKETAFALPVLIFIYDRLGGKDERMVSTAAVKRYLPYAVAAAAYLALRIHSMGGMVPAEKSYSYLSSFQYALNASVLFAQYMKTLAAPAGGYPFPVLNPVFHLSEPRALFSVIIAFLIPAAAFLSRRKVNPLYILALSIMILPLLPALYIPGLSRNPFADRYMYLPSSGLALLLTLSAKDAAGLTGGRKPVIISITAIFSALTILYSAAAVNRNTAWKDEYTLWGASLNGAPDENYFAAYKIGAAFLSDNLLDQAMDKFKASMRMIDSSQHPDPEISWYSGMGMAYIYELRGDYDSEAAEFERLLKLKPDNYFAAYTLAGVYRKKGLTGAAVDLYKKAVRLAKKPAEMKDAYNGLGDSYGQEGRLPEALTSYGEALKAAPGDPATLNNMDAVKRAIAKQGSIFR